jgi:hypothetical protein
VDLDVYFKFQMGELSFLKVTKLNMFPMFQIRTRQTKFKFSLKSVHVIGRINLTRTHKKYKKEG